MISLSIIEKCENAAYNMRQNIIRLAHQAGNNGSHIGPSLSIVDIMAVLYLHVMKLKPEDSLWNERDRFILSKGHGALGCYVAMHEAGVISKEDLFSYEVNGSKFPGQPSKCLAKGIEYSGGSLGMGLSYGAGIALAAKRANQNVRTFVLMGDGELNEGSVWESVMFARHQNLSNLIVVVDRNSMQSDGACGEIMSYDIDAVWKGFGWAVEKCDGHNIEELINAFENMSISGPTVVIAKTIKGKGVSFMEHSKDWHHNRLTDELYNRAIAELVKTEVHCNDI